jgi:hypothetical protein
MIIALFTPLTTSMTISLAEVSIGADPVDPDIRAHPEEDQVFRFIVPK